MVGCYTRILKEGCAQAVKEEQKRKIYEKQFLLNDVLNYPSRKKKKTGERVTVVVDDTTMSTVQQYNNKKVNRVI